MSPLILRSVQELLALKSIMRHVQSQDEIEEGTSQCMVLLVEMSLHLMLLLCQEDQRFFSTLVLRMVWVREAEFSTRVTDWNSQCWVLGQTCQWIWDAIRHSEIVGAIAGSNSRRQYQKQVSTRTTWYRSDR